MLSGPVEKSGTAVSIACLVGYATFMFAFILYGSMLNQSLGIEGKRLVFLTMIALGVKGFIMSS